MRCHRNEITVGTTISSMKRSLELTNCCNFSTSLVVFASNVGRLGFFDGVVYLCPSVHELPSP